MAISESEIAPCFFLPIPEKTKFLQFFQMIAGWLGVWKDKEDLCEKGPLKRMSIQNTFELWAFLVVKQEHLKCNLQTKQFL